MIANNKKIEHYAQFFYCQYFAAPFTFIKNWGIWGRATRLITFNVTIIPNFGSDFKQFLNFYEIIYGESVALTLKTGRKVFIVPEENYDDISHFIII